MKDLIKREDAIGAIEGTDWYHQNRNKDMVSGANSDEHQAWYKAEDVYKALEAVPSADRPIIYGNEHNCIMTMFGECSYAETGCGDCAVVEKVRKALSADRPQGKWIDRSDGGRILNPWWETYECSKCGQYGTRIWDYCPNCGCRMKDVTEGLESRTDLIWYGDKTDLIGDETGRHTGWFGKGADDEDN